MLIVGNFSINILNILDLSDKYGKVIIIFKTMGKWKKKKGRECCCCFCSYCWGLSSWHIPIKNWWKEQHKKKEQKKTPEQEFIPSLSTRHKHTFYCCGNSEKKTQIFAPDVRIMSKSLVLEFLNSFLISDLLLRIFFLFKVLGPI